MKEATRKITLEQVAEAANTLAEKIWKRCWRWWTELVKRYEYYQRRNEASHRSRRKMAALRHNTS